MLMPSKIAVLGAGMVGVSCALALQARGARVTLIDRREPGRETSYGNAGVASRGSLMPFNNPALWKSLPALAGNRTVQLRYSPSYLLRSVRWAAGFLANTRAPVFEQTTAALDALVTLSLGLHRQWSQAAGVARRWRDDGWLYLYRQAAAFEAAHASRAVLARHGVRLQSLDRQALRDIEPGLRPVFERALWIQDASSADSPGAVTAAYAEWFARQGGRVLRQPVARVVAQGAGWGVVAQGEHVEVYDQVVVALGPWSADFLRPLGLRVPMACERGYHMHFAAQPGAVLGRPVYDTAGGYVLAPMEQGLRLSTGVELADRDAPPSHAQLALAEQAARQAFALAHRLEAEPWLGSRPTLPDSRPMIGESPRHRGLWLAFGHQHIGFSSGPATAQVLAALMAGEAPPIDARPFAPGRFLL